MDNSERNHCGVAGAGAGIRPFVLDECVRSGSTLATNLTLVPEAGGVIEETIPRPGESIPSVADSVTFEVSCILFSGTTPNPSQATITVQGMCLFSFLPSHPSHSLYNTHLPSSTQLLLG